METQIVEQNEAEQEDVPVVIAIKLNRQNLSLERV